MRIVSLISIVIFALICGCAGGGTSGTGGFNYKGTIAELSGSPAENATVTLEFPNGQEIATSQTEKDGKFEFSNIESSDVVLKLALRSGETTELVISIPEGQNVARIALKQIAAGFEKSVVFEKEQNKSANGSSSSQGSERGFSSESNNQNSSSNSTGAPSSSASNGPSSDQGGGS